MTLFKSRYVLYLSTFALILLLGFWFFTPLTAKAVTVSPHRIEINADPGDTAFGEFKIFNEKSEPVNFFIKFKTFRAKDESGNPDFSGENDEFINWIVAPEEVKVNSKDFKEVTFKVNVPAQAEPGAYFAAIFASLVPVSSNDQSVINLGTDTGTLILFKVNGDLKEGVNIVEFNTKDKKTSFLELPIEFYYRLQNGSPTFIKPLGDIVITNFLGSTTKIIPQNLDKSNILPGTIRRFEASWFDAGGNQIQNLTDKTTAPPTTFWGHVNHQWRNFALGKYTAKLNIAVGKSSDQAAMAETSFWIIPWHLLLVVGVILFIFFGGIILIALILAFFFMRSYSKKAKKRSKKSVKTKQKVKNLTSNPEKQDSQEANIDPNQNP